MPLPDGGVLPTQSCILRRDIDGQNQYPVRNGAEFSTAIELPYYQSSTSSELTVPGTAPVGGGGGPGDTEGFMRSIFGDSLYAEGLGRNYSGSCPLCEVWY